MKILVPVNNTENLYFNEIYSTFESHGYELTYYKNGLPETDARSYDFVHVHWPEALTNWTDPTTDQIEVVDKWLQDANCVICTRHNYEPHMLGNANGKKLYQTVYKNADGFIHLGQFSLLDYKKQYKEGSKNQLHTVIPHPLYSLYPNTIEQDNSRSLLGLPGRASIVLVFGAIRYQSERKLLLTVYRNLRTPNKLLVVSRQLRSCFLSKSFRGVGKLRKINEFFKKSLLNEYNFYGPVANSDVQLFLNAADVLFVPRADVLNSGIPFLAWSFDKVVVAPDCGNITECMKAMGNPLYKPGDVDSAALALEKGIELSSKFEPDDLNHRAEELYRPDMISAMTKEFFDQVLEHSKPQKT